LRSTRTPKSPEAPNHLWLRGLGACIVPACGRQTSSSVAHTLDGPASPAGRPSPERCSSESAHRMIHKPHVRLKDKTRGRVCQYPQAQSIGSRRRVRHSEAELKA